jgi:hypothetical protein
VLEYLTGWRRRVWLVALGLFLTLALADCLFCFLLIVRAA